MNKTAVIFQSKYGATEKYAKWLAQELSSDLIKTSEVKIKDMDKYDTIILGGGIYATGIAGISFFKKHYDQLKNKKLVVFAVGASPYDEKAMEQLKAKNFKGELSSVPCFYCRGAWNEEIMSWTDRKLCSMLKNMVAKKDPTTYEPWEKALMDAIGSSCDWTKKEELKPIIDFIREK